MKRLIQLERVTVSATSRTYQFMVIDGSGESRRFFVQVPLESFRAMSLKFQDGPQISSELLVQELDRETQQVHAEAHLNVGEPDIQKYLERHYPPKVRKWNPVAKA
ncbi:MAG: hypothetical protein HY647_02070 [Acidobacteria bacterium]|nr:hypothetical protein [Acidobacteriota bacterium]